MLKYLFEQEVLCNEHEPGFYGPTEPEYFIRNVALAQLKHKIQYIPLSAGLARVTVRLYDGT